MITLETLRQPIPGDYPCGADLSGNEKYLEIGRQIQQRDSNYSQLNWAGIEDGCFSFLEHTRDLRLGMIWSLACLQRGLGPWKDSLDTLAAWVRSPSEGKKEGKEQDLWVNLFPRKLNARMILVSQFAAEYATEGEFVFVKTLSRLPLADAASPASRTLRDWDDGRRKEVMEAIQASSPEFVGKLAQKVDGCREAFRALVTALLQRLPDDDKTNRDRCQHTQSSMLHSESGVLGRIDKLLKSVRPAAAPAPVQALTVCAEPAPLHNAPPPTNRWKIESRTQVLPRLDAIIAYYTREPSSPVRLVLRQARRLVDLDFLSAVKELLGDNGLSACAKLTGTVEANKQVSTTPPPPSGQPAGQAAMDAIPGPEILPKVDSPADVLAALDALCVYFSQDEPSSPVPLLILRAHRLVGVNFRTAVEDLLGKEGLAAVDTLGGGAKAKTTP